MSAPTAVNTSSTSAECTLAERPGYGDLHDQCRKTEDVPLPWSKGVLLVRRCDCRCHERTKGRS